MPDVQVWVWRGDASGGDFMPYKVDADEGMVVLDVVHRIQAQKAPDLAVPAAPRSTAIRSSCA
jgi:succinate dehydrogenase/fumarate reductase-like Fe-S protein